MVDFFVTGVISCVLKNVGVTYQQLVNMIFKDQIGRNMEVYRVIYYLKTDPLMIILPTSKRSSIHYANIK